jgi:hypothetical protein
MFFGAISDVKPCRHTMDLRDILLDLIGMRSTEDEHLLDLAETETLERPGQ